MRAGGTNSCGYWESRGGKIYMGGMDLRWVSWWCQSRGTSASGHSPAWAKEHTSARVVTLKEKNSLTVSLFNRLRLRFLRDGKQAPLPLHATSALLPPLYPTISIGIYPSYLLTDQIPSTEPTPPSPRFTSRRGYLWACHSQMFTTYPPSPFMTVCIWWQYIKHFG